MLGQQIVDAENITPALIEGDHQNGIPGDPCVKLGHAVKGQGGLGFLQCHVGSIADPQNVIALFGAFFFGKQLVAIPVGNIRTEKDLLLGQTVFLQDPVDVFREGPVGGHKAVGVVSEELIDVVWLCFLEDMFQFICGFSCHFISPFTKNVIYCLRLILERVRVLTVSDELRMSYYREIADIEADHGVFLVQDIRTGKIYVKKVLTVYNLEVFRYLMVHPVRHTPRIRELAEDGYTLIVIEEYIPGDTLQELLDKSGPMPEERVIDITLQLCRILEDFHRCQPPIVNRDIKPANIKLTGDGFVKLLDLNAAKRYNGESQRDTVLIGTEGYAAPEQYGFGPSSVLTDVYSVGVLMQVLLTGSLSGGAPMGSRLGHIIARCVELSPKSRYRSIAALRAALEALQENKSAREASGWRRFLPPGFRSDNPVRWFFSFAGYLFLLYLCFSLQVKNAGIVELWINRVSMTAVSLAIVLFSGNYLDIQSRVALTKGKNPLLRLLGVLIIDAAIAFFGVMAMSVIVSILI